MNIFVTSPSPLKSAQVLPDKHIVKMPLECCQMLSIIASDKWGHNYGTLPKADGTPYQTDKGAFRHHPCTVWASETPANSRWLIEHALALCEEYTSRYGKVHSCLSAILVASKIFPEADSSEHTPFVRAMPVEFKLDTSISTFDAYKMYVSSKPWVVDNYLRIPDRKPEWV